jgi:hypothetical protein
MQKKSRSEKSDVSTHPKRTLFLYFASPEPEIDENKKINYHTLCFFWLLNVCELGQETTQRNINGAIPFRLVDRGAK